VSVTAAGNKSHLLNIPNSSPAFSPFQAVQPYNFMFPYLSTRRTAGMTDVVGSQYSNKVSGTLEYLQSKIDRVISANQLRPLFEDACKLVFGYSISTFPTSSGKLAGLEVNPIKQHNIPISNMGAGVPNALGLIVDLLVAEDRVFVIEELENDMHPKALETVNFFV
jgi:hypothetical protein